MAYEAIYVAAVLASSAIGLVVAAWLYSDDLDRATRLFVALVLLYPVTGILVVGELLAPTRSLAVTFYGLHTAVATAIPPVWFLFTVAYTSNRPRLLRRLAAAVLGATAVVSILTATNPIHHLMWTEYRTITEPFTHYVGVPTTLFMLLAFPLSFLYYAGMAVLGSHVLFGPKVRRTQTLLLFLGYLPPFFITTAWFAGVLPGPFNGVLVIGSTWFLGIAAWAVFRHQLFDLVPLARETVFETIDEAVVVVDREHRILDHNRSAVEAFPDLDGAEGTPVGSVIPGIFASEPDDDADDETGADADDAAADDGSTRFADGFTWSGGAEPIEYDVAVSSLSFDGEVQGFGLVLRDVTERRKRMRDLEQKTAQLERFASTLSHDIRNPLNVAQGRLELARQTADDGEHVEEASAALDRIQGIVDDLLTLAREGRSIDERERVRLPAVFEKAAETTDTKAAMIEIADDADVAVYADETRLRNVFENLLRNAVQHGGPDVTIRLGRHADGFYVEDDGPGVPPEKRDRVFEYEFTTTREGTGLGLAIVESIAHAHGWSVEMTEGRAGGARIVFSDVDVLPADGSGDGERQR